jgi:hypothetical protein
MKRPILLASMFLLLAGFATAQDAPTVDVAAGYSALYILKGYTIWMNGGRATAGFNVNNWFGVVGDFGGYVGHVPEIFNGETYMAGPRFTYRKLPIVSPFVEALFGGSHFSTSTGGITGGGSEFAFNIGGGGDIGLGRSQKFALRLEGDYVGIRSSGSITDAARLSAGIVYRFGGK